MSIKNLGIPINLQMFAEQPSKEEPQPQQNINDPALQAKVMEMFNNQQGQGTPQEGQGQEAQMNNQGNPGEQPPQAPNGQPQQPQQQIDPQAEKILGKFNSPEDLAKAYENLEAFNTQTRQELSQYKDIAAQLKDAIESMKQQNAENTQTPNNMENNNTPGNQEQELTPENFMDKFYENPIEAIKTILQPQLQGVIQQVQPVIQRDQEAQKQQDWMNRVNQFAQNHPDLDKFNQPMADLLGQYPDLKDNPKGLDILYSMAKGNSYIDPNTILQNQDYVKNNILNNPEIRNAVITEYLNQLKQGQAPVTVAGQNNQPGGQIPLTPENKPQDFKEAGLMAMKLFNNK